MKHIVAGIVGLVILGGCGYEDVPRTQAELPPPPPASLVNKKMRDAYNGVATLRNVEITRIAPDNIIGPNQWDYYACATVTRDREFSTVRTDGSVIHEIGSPRDDVYVMFLRKYDNGWGTGGIVRRTGEGVKIGRRKTLDLCPKR